VTGSDHAHGKGIRATIASMRLPRLREERLGRFEPVAIDEGTAADVFPGIKDAHEGDDEGWMARWLERPTWDRRVTPNVIKRTGTRPKRRR